MGGTKVVCLEDHESLWSAYDQLVVFNNQFPDNLDVSATLVLNELDRNKVGPEGILLLDQQQKMVGLIRPAGTELYKYAYAYTLYLRSAEGRRWVENLRVTPF